MMLNMNTPVAKMAFHPIPIKLGLEWQILADHPSGLREYINGFGSEDEALRWIESARCAEWIRARGFEP
jgi:hypothetical protein